MSNATRAGVWTWDFSSPAELREALEEYTAFQDGTVLRRYGHEGLRVAVDERGNPILGDDGQPVMLPDLEPSRNPEELARVEMNMARRRSEIDQSMEILRHRFPHWWRLIDLYYRQGYSTEPRGWLLPAVVMGCHKGKCPPLVRCPVSPGDNRRDLPECQRRQKNHCYWDHDTFMRQVALAVARLFDAHRDRSQRTS